MARFSVAAAMLVTAGVAGVAVPAYGAEETGTICSSNTGTVKLRPGLEETVAKVQNVVIKGELSDCTGSTVTGARYVAHLKTAGAVTCATIGTGEVASGTIVIKWSPKGQHNSHGTVEMTIGSSSSAMLGPIASGPFTGDGFYSPVNESFGSCGDKKAKLKLGSVSGSAARVAAPPSAEVESPASGGVYTLGAVVPTTFSCSEGLFGPGLESCTDSNGASGGSGFLDTSELGEHTYAAIARSLDGLKGRDGIHYEVVE